MEVKTEDLRRIFSSLMNHLEATGQASTELPWDFYWDIPREALYNPYAQPERLSLGQLSDDWDELLKIDSESMPAVGYATVWLASVLRAVGEASKL